MEKIDALEFFKKLYPELVDAKTDSLSLVYLGVLYFITRIGASGGVIHYRTLSSQEWTLSLKPDDFEVTEVSNQLFALGQRRTIQIHLRG